MNKNFYYAIFCLIVTALVASCSTVRSQTEISKVINTDAADALAGRAVAEEEVYTSFVIKNTDLRLVNADGRCTLRYTSRENQVEKSLDMGMVGPCNFVGLGDKIIPQHVIYGKGTERRAVFLITGGPPSAEFSHVKDRFMPNGCGTSLAKIYVFDARVKLAWTDDKSPPTCPSRGTDPILFY